MRGELNTGKRQKVAAPVNHPQVKAYQKLWRRFDKERKSAKTIYEQIALDKAARVMMLAAEDEKLMHYGPYER